MKNNSSNKIIRDIQINYTNDDFMQFYNCIHLSAVDLKVKCVRPDPG